MLIRYGGLIANYHHGFTPNSRLVIWLHGFPGLPKESDDKDFIVFFASGYDVVVPDYYGSHCSDGVFSPQGCIDTLVDTYNFFKEGGTAYYSRNGREIVVSRYDEIIVVGASFGAWFASRMQQYISECKIIGLRYPFMEASNRATGEYEGEMANEEDYKELNIGGQEHLYRGRGSIEWDQFHEDQRGQSYDEMIQDLGQKDVYIVHGDADECVHVGRSRKLYEQLQTVNPSGNHRYLEIAKGGHGGITKQIGVVEFCKWLNGR